MSADTNVRIVLLVLVNVLTFISPLRAEPARPVFLGSFHWTFSKYYFGGMSGIDLTEDGQQFIAVSDNAQVMKGTIRRDGDSIVGMEFGLDYIPRLRGTDGKPLDSVGDTDAEGIALMSDGRFYVSFEEHHRILAYDDWRGSATVLPNDPAFAGFSRNSGMEALAVGSDGTLYTLPEGLQDIWRDRNLYRYRDGLWEVFGTVKESRLFRPVGADVGPDGMFYLLERRYVPLAGFASRVRRFRIGAAGLADERVLLETAFGEFDNLEGIALWRGEDGDLRMTMVSDDNHSRWQQTQVVEFRLPGDLAAGGETR